MTNIENVEISIDDFENTKVKIMKDFLKFKNNNELAFCSLHEEGIRNDEVKVVWYTTKKFTTKFENEDNVEKIQHELKMIEEETKKSGSISKITCSENCHIVEFSFHITYRIKK